ncbi:MAG TPA: hypothetical protein IAA30_08650 [Candidatus Treponema faecavium]|nr:hypothetical protein [Candidatus Treponema faecavium]
MNKHRLVKTAAVMFLVCRLYPAAAQQAAASAAQEQPQNAPQNAPHAQLLPNGEPAENTADRSGSPQSWYRISPEKLKLLLARIEAELTDTAVQAALQTQRLLTEQYRMEREQEERRERVWRAVIFAAALIAGGAAGGIAAGMAAGAL